MDAGHERRETVGRLADDHAAGSDCLASALPVEVELVIAVHEDHDPTRCKRWLDRFLRGEEPHIGAPLPQHSACVGDQSFASRRSFGDEGDVDLTVLAVGVISGRRACSRRRRTSAVTVLPVVSIDDHQPPILDHHAGLRSSARGVPGLHRQRAIADLLRLGVVRRRRLLDATGGRRGTGIVGTAGPSNSGCPAIAERRNRRGVERCAADGPRRVRRLPGSRRPAGAVGAATDGLAHRLHRRRRLRLQRRDPRAGRRTRCRRLPQARLVAGAVQVVDVHMPPVDAATRRHHRGRRLPRRASTDRRITISSFGRPN